MFYASDFETITEKNKTYVYLACLFDGKKYKIFYNVKDYLFYVLNKNMKIYFHNLKFDISFILDYFFRYNLNETYELNTIITQTKQYFTVKIINKKTCKYVEFRDSLKLLNTSISKLGEILNLKKLDVDYKNLNTNIKKEIDYIKRDCEILYKSLENFKNLLSEFKIKKFPMSLATAAFLIFSKISGFKTIELNDNLNKKLRKNYRGGFCYLNPAFKNRKLKNVTSYDINSSYPNVMLNEYLPLGRNLTKKQIEIIGKEKLFCFQEIEFFDYKVKTYPFYFSKKFFKNEYILESKNLRFLSTKDEIDFIIKNSYYKSYKIINEYYFHKSNTIFKDFIEYFYEKKSKSQGFERFFYKSILNSLYGKFGQKTDRITSKIVGINDNNYFIYEDELTTSDIFSTYLPLAVSITAQARLNLFEKILKCDKNFIYSDTDSIYFLDNNKIVLGNNTNLIGDLKIEHLKCEAKFLKQKTYLLKENDKYIIKIAGLSKNFKDVNFENFKENTIFKNVNLKMKKISGGYSLVESDFMLK